MKETGLTVSTKPSALSVMAARFDMEPAKLMDTLKNTVFKGATNEQLAALVVVANEHRLNPFLREVYAFPDKSGGIQAVIGVDGWLKIINSNDRFDGCEFQQDDHSCTCTMYVKGRSHPVKITEWLDECKRNTEPWRTYPRRMLRHKAIIQCARVALGFGGLRDEDDIMVHPASVTVSATPANLFTGEPVQSPALPEPAPVADKPAPLVDADTTVAITPQQDLERFLNECEVSFDDTRSFLQTKGLIKDADTIPDWQWMPSGVVKRLRDDVKLMAELVKKFGKVQKGEAQ